MKQASKNPATASKQPAAPQDFFPDSIYAEFNRSLAIISSLRYASEKHFGLSTANWHILNGLGTVTLGSIALIGGGPIGAFSGIVAAMGLASGVGEFGLGFAELLTHNHSGIAGIDATTDIPLDLSSGPFPMGFAAVGSLSSLIHGTEDPATALRRWIYEGKVANFVPESVSIGQSVLRGENLQATAGSIGLVRDFIELGGPPATPSHALQPQPDPMRALNGMSSSPPPFYSTLNFNHPYQVADIGSLPIPSETEHPPIDDSADRLVLGTPVDEIFGDPQANQLKRPDGQSVRSWNGYADLLPVALGGTGDWDSNTAPACFESDDLDYQTETTLGPSGSLLP